MLLNYHFQTLGHTASMSQQRFSLTQSFKINVLLGLSFIYIIFSESISSHVRLEFHFFTTVNNKFRLKRERDYKWIILRFPNNKLAQYPNIISKTNKPSYLGGRWKFFCDSNSIWSTAFDTVTFPLNGQCGWFPYTKIPSLKYQPKNIYKTVRSS